MNINFWTNRVSDHKWHLDLVTILVTVDNNDSTNFFVNCRFSRFCINHLVNNLCIFTRVAWCHTSLISLVTFHFRNKSHSSLSWIVRIICVSNCFNTWDWIPFFVNGNNLTKFSVSYSLNLAVHSDILRSHTAFIGEVTVNHWCNHEIKLSLICLPFTSCKNITCYRIKRQWTFPLCFLNTICWQFSIAIFACIVNSVCHIFKVSILSWPFWTVWLVRIDWSSWFVCIVWIKVKCYTFEAYCPSLVNCAIQVKACTSWVTICHKGIAKVLIVFDTFSCWVVNRFARLTSQSNCFKDWTTCFITVSNTCFLIVLNVNNLSIARQVTWCGRYNLNSVARNAWKRLVDGNHLSRIIRIVCVGSCWYTWNWISIFIHSDKFTKGFVCHCVCCIWCIWSNCLTTCYSFIGIVTSNNWSLNCSISVASFCPSCCVSCRVFFTVEAKVILSVGSWCLRISTIVSHCLTSGFSDISSVFFNDNVVMVTWS